MPLDSDVVDSARHPRASDRRWLPPLALTLAIYTTLPLVSGVRRWVKTHIGEWPIRYLATTSFVLTAAWALVQVLRGRRRRDPWFWAQVAALGVLDIVCLGTHRSEPIEQMHLFEYGTLVVLVLRALPDDLGRWHRQGLALVSTSTLGFIDELLQGFINRHYESMLGTLVRWFHTDPDTMKNFFFIRFFDWRDVQFNVASAALGLWTWALWCSARERR